MIDIRSEKLIRLVDVPGLPWLPTRRGGATLARSTVWRWATKGINGVTLETVAIGRALCTTEAALMRFLERLAMPAATSTTSTPSQRRKAIERAETILRANGII